MTTIATLFESEPPHWGLRGDPLLWREMKASLESVTMPEALAELEAVLHATFIDLTGNRLDSSDAFRIDRYDRGGMSGGLVCPEFWRNEAMPLLFFPIPCGEGGW